MNFTFKRSSDDTNIFGEIYITRISNVKQLNNLELSPIPEKNKDPFDKIQGLETVSSTGESL